MGKKWNKKILTVLMQWDYGDKSRGPSPEKFWFYDNFVGLIDKVEPLWYNEYLHDVPRLQQLLLEKAEKLNPDLIFFLPYTGQFQTGTLDLLRKKWPTCAWFGDDTWRFESYSSGLAPHFSFVCTTDPFSVGKYRKIGVEPILTQWAGQLHSAGPAALPPDKYEYEVSFVGGENSVRRWFITRLKKMGIETACFGKGWTKGRISFEEMEHVFLKSRINLNLSNSATGNIGYLTGSLRNLASYFIARKTAEQIKARNFEIPLAGGFQLTNYVAGLERYLKIGEEAAVFSSPEECARQARYYLDNEDERLSILKAGHERAQKEHTYLSRLAKILERIWG